MRRLLPGLVALVAACGPAELPGGTPPWVVFHRVGPAIDLVDTARIAARSGVADLWVRQELLLPGSAEAAQPASGQGESHLRLDCARRRVNETSIVFRDTAGFILGQRGGRPQSRFDTHPLGKEVLPALCLYLKRRDLI